jgi:hypothetical protein
MPIQRHGIRPLHKSHVASLARHALLHALAKGHSAELAFESSSRSLSLKTFKHQFNGLKFIEHAIPESKKREFNMLVGGSSVGKTVIMVDVIAFHGEGRAKRKGNYGLFVVFRSVVLHAIESEVSKLSVDVQKS